MTKSLARTVRESMEFPFEYKSNGSATHPRYQIHLTQDVRYKDVLMKAGTSIRVNCFHVKGTKNMSIATWAHGINSRSECLENTAARVQNKYVRSYESYIRIDARDPEVGLNKVLDRIMSHAYNRDGQEGAKYDEKTAQYHYRHFGISYVPE